MESTLESIIRPRHQEVSDITDDVPGTKFDFGPFIAESELGDYFSTRTDLKTTLSFPLKE